MPNTNTYTPKTYTPVSGIELMDPNRCYPKGYYEYHIVKDLGYFIAEQMIENRKTEWFYQNFYNEVCQMIYTEDYYREGPAEDYMNMAFQFGNIHALLYTMYETAMMAITRI